MPKINQLNSKTVPSNNDEFPFHDPNSGTTREITRGDLIGGAPLPANSVNEQAITGGSVTPGKRAGGFQVGVISSSTMSTTGNKNITGVGFTPKLVRFTLMPAQAANNGAIAVGAATATTQYYSAMASSSSGFSRLSSTTSCIAAATAGSGSAAMAASFVSMNSDGFTINVTIASSTFDVAYEAYA